MGGGGWYQGSLLSASRSLTSHDQVLQLQEQYVLAFMKRPNGGIHGAGTFSVQGHMQAALVGT